MRKTTYADYAPVVLPNASGFKRKASVALLLTLVLASGLSALRSQHLASPTVQVADGGNTKPGGG